MSLRMKQVAPELISWQWHDTGKTSSPTGLKANTFSIFKEALMTISLFSTTMRSSLRTKTWSTPSTSRNSEEMSFRSTLRCHCMTILNFHRICSRRSRFGTTQERETGGCLEPLRRKGQSRFTSSIRISTMKTAKVWSAGRPKAIPC